LKPVFEEAGHVNLSELRLMTIDDYVKGREIEIKLRENEMAEEGKIIGAGFGKITGLGYRIQLLGHKSVSAAYQYDKNAIVINEPKLVKDLDKFEWINPTYVMTHELAHAVHFAREPAMKLEEDDKNPFSDMLEDIFNDTELSIFAKAKEMLYLVTSMPLVIMEGFADYFIFDYISQFDQELTDLFDWMREDALTYKRTGARNRELTWAWYKHHVPGYLFFREVVELSGDTEIIWDILRYPPTRAEHLENPQLYLNLLNEHKQQESIDLC